MLVNIQKLGTITYSDRSVKVVSKDKKYLEVQNNILVVCIVDPPKSQTISCMYLLVEENWEDCLRRGMERKYMKIIAKDR